MLQCDNSLTSLDTVTSPLTDCPESTEEEHSSCVGRQDVEEVEMFRPPSTIPQQVVDDWILNCMNMLKEQGRDGEDDLKGISVEHNAEAFGETTTVLTLQ